jgi:hypothetical protein
MKVKFSKNSKIDIKKYYNNYQDTYKNGYHQTDMEKRVSNVKRVEQIMQHFDMYLDNTRVYKDCNYIDVDKIATVEYIETNQSILIQNIFFKDIDNFLENRVILRNLVEKYFKTIVEQYLSTEMVTKPLLSESNKPHISCSKQVMMSEGVIKEIIQKHIINYLLENHIKTMNVTAISLDGAKENLRRYLKESFLDDVEPCPDPTIKKFNSTSLNG